MRARTLPRHERGPVVLDQTRCVHCGLCTGVCPPLALTMDRQSWTLVYDAGKCTGCGACTGACPLGALSAASNG